jgi:hypothetical protein
MARPVKKVIGVSKLMLDLAFIVLAIYSSLVVYQNCDEFYCDTFRLLALGFEFDLEGVSPKQ